MEVHHHPDLHHNKKKFKEYFLEFLMIFLAVTLGFIAENVRERIGDHSKEKEYIESLIQDLKYDTSVATHTMIGTARQIRGLDTLENLLTPEINKSDSAIYTCYRLQPSLHNENTMNFNDRTITQLVSSGNMRLIRKQAVSDRISEYYSEIKRTENQKKYYLDYFNRCLDIYQHIYEFKSYHSKMNEDGQLAYPKYQIGTIRIADTNPENLTKYNATMELTKRIIYSYRSDIEKLRTQGDSLIDFLEEEYSLKKD